MLRFITQDKDKNQRLDSFIVGRVKKLSRSFIQKLSDQGRVLVNNEPGKSGHRLKTGDKVTLDYDLSKSEEIPQIKLPIIYEDKDCIVINKSPGVLTHSKGAFNPEGTVATFIAPHLRNLSGDRAGIVHRLDRATSGVIIAAKNPEALSWLQKQFSKRNVKKVYIALVEGTPEPSKAVIDMPIERNPKQPQTFRVGSNGKPAQTKYEVIKSKKGLSLLRLEPTTGRTHQLRVHLKQLGHPIIGDALYGTKTEERLYLHALSLEITLPSRERRKFETELPKEFNKKLDG